jgi:thiamine kinase-like enzyme
LGWTAPVIAERVVMLGERIGRALFETSPQVMAPTHGDLHLGQVLVTSDQVRLLDFDRACLADPMEDLGGLYAALSRLDNRGDPHLCIQSCFEDLLHEYANFGGEVHHGRIKLYAAYRQFASAIESFRYRHDDWLAEITQCVDQIEHNLHQMQGSQHNVPIHLDANVRRMSTPIRIEDPYNIPADPALMPTRDPVDPDAAHRVCEHLKSDDGQHAGLELEVIRVHRHKPGRRCLIEYYGSSLSTGEPISLLGKIDGKGRYRRCFSRQRELWEAGFQDAAADGICVARPWNIVPEWKMWVQQKSNGSDGWHALRGRCGCDAAQRIAQALCKLHDAPMVAMPFHSLHDELAILDDRLSRASQMAPAQARQIEDVRRKCYDAADAIPRAANVLIHRDFYPDQVLLDDRRVILLDFDLLSIGDAAIDVGNFRAHLIEHSLRTTGAEFAYLAQDRAFVSEYRRLRPSVPAKSIDLFTTLSLARHVYLCLVLPRRGQNLALVLDAIQRIGASEACRPTLQSCL